MSDKLQKLLAMLTRNERDTFVLYAIAMEHKKRNESPQVIEFLDRALRVDPNYAYAYYQKGQMYERGGDLESARQSYRQGIQAAQRTGDAKALGELSGALEFIET